MAGPYLPNLEPFIAAGIDPKTGLPIKMAATDSVRLRENMQRLMRIVDRQDAITKGTWYNLPKGLSSLQMERILYTKGQAAFFCLEQGDELRFFFLPYALDGTIDVYGRYTGITPLPYGSGSTENGRKQEPWIQGLHKNVVWDPVMPEDLTEKDMLESAVLLWDYSPAFEQMVIPRMIINEPVINVEADILPFARTALLSSTGVKGMRVQDESQTAQVLNASRSLEDAALTGQYYVPMVGPTEFQEMTDGSAAKPIEYMQTLESIDNYRLSLHGIENGGLFQKKSHMLESEQALAGNPASSVMKDAIQLRQNFCTIVNSIWPLGIWWEPDQNLNVMGADLMGDNQTGSDSGSDEEGGQNDDSV